MNYFEHHIGDFLKKTAHLSAVEDGIYRRLLDRYYTTEAPLPVDPQECCRLARATSKAEREAVSTVLRDYFTPDVNGHRQKRADEEIARFKDKQAKAKRSAEARWDAERKRGEGDAGASGHSMRTHSEGIADGMPRTPVPSNQPPVARESARATPLPTTERGSRLPTDWTLPGDWRTWAEGERPDIDVLKAAMQFLDFWLAQPGSKGRKADWQATWRNWVRNERAPTGFKGIARHAVLGSDDVFTGASQ